MVLSPYLKGSIFTHDTKKQKFLTGNHANGPDVGRMGPSVLRLALVQHSSNKFCLSALRVLCKTPELSAERNLLLLNTLMISIHLIYHYLVEYMLSALLFEFSAAPNQLYKDPILIFLLN